MSISRIGLRALDAELAKHHMIVAFSPITVITAGGFVAVTYLQNRNATGDLDYLLAPEWAADPDIKNSLRDAIIKVSNDLGFNYEWANDDMAIFVTHEAQKWLFEQAEKQDIVLFLGQHIRVLAAPIEWAVERKIRRLFEGTRDRKAVFDLSDCLAMLKWLRDRNDGPLDRERIRGLDVNGFGVGPDKATMDTIATAYCEKYGERIFF
ncbi:conserved hypothetical protein [Histoplasma capsulatum var. duboisii H88]|uniref:Nucleotidyltransferase n=4 Tax=Ajellomyces capsulatus TaxID=5037 RepID=C0NIQ8_AJECG|nr:uncharacterized protein HCBG_02315 [Histoplasma capsulatum G186AR]EER43559.1 conserved hypothetical protein [Histoplasma capsulatum H143]EGC42086.1 conserved hypothetical protein [Histoplasma capsulatum var. duboisii H88]KAG5303914.1 hypothetical protein I7I52_02059 [Histoplasma capsulatum]EEH08778.1 conserved hypothetical protein [Histoplasma capsulatum G186AR]QSS69512.1 hypothetical protein I7I50_10820 [Histoplasma capsulatum G186AR]